MLADSWSMGVLVGLPIAIICIVLSLLAIAWGVMLIRDRDFDGWLLFWSSVLCLVATLAISGWAFYPYQAQYHKWHQSTGIIKTISSRFLGDGDSGTTQRFVVEFTNGDIRSCDDTRCALLKPGYKLTLTCKREWQFSGTDGWSCNYVRAQKG